MRVGVTGLSGFTGRYMSSALVRRGHEVLPIAADLGDQDALTDEIQCARPDAVVHLAGRAFVDSSDQDAFYATNQIGTFHLLNALAQGAPGVPVLLASSAQIYGIKASGLMSEDAAIAPSNHYALSKAAMEMGSRLWKDRLRITIVRPFNYTGIGQGTDYIIPKLVSHFQRRDPVISLGNVDVERDFGDVRAVADAYCRLIELSPTTVLNIGTGVLTSIRSIIARLTALTKHSIEIAADPKFFRAGDAPTLGGDVSKLRSLLPDWSPRSLDDTLAWMLAD